MKVMIIGDVHIGASYGLGKKDHISGKNTRFVDYTSTLEKTIDIAIDYGCEIIIFTGDIFEHRQPNALYQKIFSQVLCYALDNGIKEIHIVVGNHDQQRISEATTLSYLQELNLPNIKVHDEISIETIHKDGAPEVNFIFLPYRDRKWFNTEDYAEAVEKLSQKLNYELKSIDNNKLKLLVGHMTLEGTFFSEEYAELYSDNELFLPKSLFKNIDYTVMGHVHTPAILSESPHISYVGSMEKRGAFEDHDKKYAILDTTSNSIVYGKEPCREIYDIKIDLSETLHKEFLMDEIFKKIKSFSDTKDLSFSIVRLLLSIAADDDKFCNPLEIEEVLYKKYQVEYCVPIKPALLFSRQARDVNINEHSSDTEAFTRYIKNIIDEKGFSETLIARGLEIIYGANKE